MKRRIATTLGLVAGVLLLVFLAVTYVALESSGVVVVHTVDFTSGETRKTRVWFVEDDGLHLEAGHPENPWVNDLAAMEVVALTGENLDGEYRFSIQGAESHTWIRSRMKRKYGWRDVWISVIFDTTQSYAVQLAPVPGK